MGVFVNFSNHPMSRWSYEQTQAALELANAEDIVDMKFPRVPTDAGPDEVEELAFECMRRIEKVIGDDEGYVMVQGEASLSCALTMIFLRPGKERIHPVCATCERFAEELPDGSVKRRFEFVRFREYCNL